MLARAIGQRARPRSVTARPTVRIQTPIEEDRLISTFERDLQIADNRRQREVDDLDIDPVPTFTMGSTSTTTRQSRSTTIKHSIVPRKKKSTQ